MGDKLKNIFEKNYENFVVDVFFERNFSKNEKKFLEILFFNFDNDSFYMSFDITNLKNLISRLRKKLPTLNIENIYGFGYRLNFIS